MSPWEALATLTAALLWAISLRRLGELGVHPFLIIGGLVAFVVADPATLAFEALREEVALVRRAVAGLSAERASIEIPDYSETLGQIMRASAATARSVKTLAELPALRLSAKDWSHEIATAAQEARCSDQQAFAEARHGFERMAAQMAAHLRSARSAERQRLDLPRFRGEVRSWDQRIWFDGILSSSFE